MRVRLSSNAQRQQQLELGRKSNERSLACTLRTLLLSHNAPHGYGYRHPVVRYDGYDHGYLRSTRSLIENTYLPLYCHEVRCRWTCWDHLSTVETCKERCQLLRRYLHEYLLWLPSQRPWLDGTCTRPLRSHAMFWRNLKILSTATELVELYTFLSCLRAWFVARLIDKGHDMTSGQGTRGLFIRIGHRAYWRSSQMGGVLWLAICSVFNATTHKDTSLYIFQERCEQDWWFLHLGSHIFKCCCFKVFLLD